MRDPDDQAGHVAELPFDGGIAIQLELLKHLDDEVWVLESDARVVYVNRAYREIALGKRALELLPPESRESFQSAFAEAWRSGSPHSCVIEWPDQTAWQSRIVALTDRRGARYVLVTTRDVTVSRSAEAMSKENEARLRSALDASGVGSWSWSMLTGALVWDARMCEIWGRKACPASYAEYLATMHPEDLDRVKALVERSLTTGHFEEFEHRIVRPSGEIRHVQCRAIALVDGEGTTIGMRGGVFDVTDRKLLEERLRNIQRLDAVGRLSAGIAHNFNNLLGIIIPNVELARDAPPELAQPCLEDIKIAAERAADLVRQLMQFGRHEPGAPKRAVALRQLVSRLLNMCQTTFGARIAIECALPDEPLPILASAGEIEQVLLNVCVNARDALSSSRTVAPAIRIELGHGSPGFMRVRITDNGPGMRSEVRARIFEPFFTTKGVGTGTGLGLASAYGIMCDHGGTISCESAHGSGTTFTIELPAAKESELEQAHKRDSVAINNNSETILLIDDELALRKVLRIILEQAGFRVLEATDGVAALELVMRAPQLIHLIVLDRSMPRMSGEQFLIELQLRGIRIPVVVLTGHGGNDTANEGAAALLHKPVATGELVRAIRNVLDQRA